MALGHKLNYKYTSEPTETNRTKFRKLPDLNDRRPIAFHFSFSFFFFFSFLLSIASVAWTFASRMSGESLCTRERSQDRGEVDRSFSRYGRLESFIARRMFLFRRFERACINLEFLKRGMLYRGKYFSGGSLRLLRNFMQIDVSESLNRKSAIWIESYFEYFVSSFRAISHSSQFSVNASNDLLISTHIRALILFWKQSLDRWWNMNYIIWKSYNALKLCCNERYLWGEVGSSCNVVPKKVK